MKKFFIFILLLSGLGFSFKILADDDNVNASPPAILVEVSKVKQAIIPTQVNALGSLVALQAVTISSEVAGRVSKIFFTDGQEVAAGMPVIQLDNSQATANYDSATTALNLSETQYNRGKLLAAEGALSQGDLDQLKANVESNRAAVKSNLAALNQKELLASFNGILGAFQVEMGDYVSPGQALVTLVNRNQLKVAYALSEDLLAELALGQQVEVISSAYPDKIFNGTVTYISPSVDPVTRSIAIQAIINNDNSLLSPGMFVHVSHNISVDPNARVVPEQAITASVKGYFVYKVVNNRAVLTQVKIGVHKNGYAQILDGLKLGDTIVVAGQQKLQDGSFVQVLNNGN